VPTITAWSTSIAGALLLVSNTQFLAPGMTVLTGGSSAQVIAGLFSSGSSSGGSITFTTPVAVGGGELAFGGRTDYQRRKRKSDPGMTTQEVRWGHR
jgi:hypothetical protein